MAYNILKGTVEFTGENGSLENTVDLLTDQTVHGGKTFTQKLTASAIVMGGTELAHPSITTVNNAATTRVALFDESSPTTALSGNANLVFSKSSLTSSFFSGSGIGLTSLQATELAGLMQGSQINRGNGLIGGGAVSVQQHDGITVDSNGVSVNLNSTGGLGILNDGKLCVNPATADDITTNGATLADADVLLVQDMTKGLRKTTLSYLYSNYISSQLPSMMAFNGSTANGLVTYGGATTADVESNLTFNGTKLSATGEISASLGVTGGSLNGDTLVVSEKSHLSSSIRSKYKMVPDPGVPLADPKYTLSTFDNVVVLNVTGVYTAELPNLNSDLDGQQYYIKNIGAGTVTITGSVATPPQKIDGDNTFVLNQGDCAKVMALHVVSGYEWTVLSYYDKA